VKRVIELIHIDIYGSIIPKFYDNHRYFINFSDDFSRKTWIYFLKVKSEVFSIFKKFKVLVENLSGERIKALRSDRGGKFISKEFVNLCEEKGSRKFLATPYSYQQNRVAKRKNQTILDTVRSMLKSKNISKDF
jgi:transposase InsO family protein